MSVKNFNIYIMKYIFSLKKITKKDTPGFDLWIIASEAWISRPTNQVTYTFMTEYEMFTNLKENFGTHSGLR